MNFHFAFFHRPGPRQPLRAIVATRSESMAVQRKRATVVSQLEDYVKSTTDKQRKAEMAAYIAVADSIAIVSKGRG